MPDVTDVPCDTDERIVRPRKRKPKRHAIVAIRNGQTLDEAGEIGTVQDLISSLPHIEQPTAFVKYAAADWLAELDREFSDDPFWQWRVTEKARDIYSPNGQKGPFTSIAVAVSFFGWKKRGHTQQRYHLLLDPITFYGRDPLPQSTIQELLKWGINLRDWSYETGIDLRPTAGGLASQLVTLPRFYPEARRKVPATINARTRDYLPGNHYQLLAPDTPDSEFDAIYLDQKRAHHYHARTTRFPNSNSLYAFGNFLTLEGMVSDSVWPEFAGMCCVRLCHPYGVSPYSPVRPPGTAYIAEPEKDYRSITTEFIFTNEISLLMDLGFTIEGVIAAWGSCEPDTGIRRYAEWAEQQLNQYSDPAWLKPVLLSTYGVLAVTPRVIQSVYKRAKHGEEILLSTGRHHLYGLLVNATNGRKIEPGFANVLHRAMIEAGTRAESLGMADYLEHAGCHVLSIYADAVIVQDDADAPLPPLLEPWTVKETLTHLQFLNTQSFVSSEMTKIPGQLGRSDALKVARGRHGLAPHKQTTDLLTGRTIVTDRRI